MLFNVYLELVLCKTANKFHRTINMKSCIVWARVSVFVLDIITFFMKQFEVGLFWKFTV